MSVKASGEILFRTGFITNGFELGGGPSGLPEDIRDILPVIVSNIPPEKWKLSTDNTHLHLGWGSFGENAEAILSFRFQVGENQAYWLADPLDPEVQQLVQMWEKNRHMAAGLIANEKFLIASGEYMLTPKLERICNQPPSKNANRFMENVCSLIASGVVEQQATSDIPFIPKLGHIDTFILATQRVHKAFLASGAQGIPWH
ncbi:MAG TPA: hypothetical protein VGN04_06250 [Herbaspirillum sp.]|jgi:hypothetical protein